MQIVIVDVAKMLEGRGVRGKVEGGRVGRMMEGGGVGGKSRRRRVEGMMERRSGFKRRLEKRR